MHSPTDASSDEDAAEQAEITARGQHAARLRSLPGLTCIRLIALTGYGRDSDVRRTRASGFEAHLVKPVDFARVRALLKGQRIENAGELRP